jgi:hypothetical protein
MGHFPTHAPQQTMCTACTIRPQRGVAVDGESLTEPSSGRRDRDGARVLTLTDRGRIVLRAMLPEL